MAVTGVIRIEDVYSNTVLESIHNKAYLECEIEHALKHGLGRMLSEIFYADHRDFVVRTAEIEKFPKSRYDTVFILSGVVLLRDRQDAQIGEHAFAQDDHEWRMTKMRNRTLAVPMRIDVLVKALPEPDTLLGLRHMTFAPVIFQFRNVSIRGWERVS